MSVERLELARADTRTGSNQTVVVAIYLGVRPRSIPVAVGGPACQPPLGHAATRPSGRREAPYAAID
ncbi:hypothetical protein PRIPAC_70945 [Pristionchus pacificus]|uniref:Uncharacterized protein n=1 Tax=Pristionchus pacificus TaxID=54126 RepID=A0A2A6C8M4_PRIPA|nr:hypothetical protein PRIPAC_70945 [Pristionchus pacificus]|eukprot:PDM74450.1 hypothetical protein PRIPAC_41806 [Pristionchus pacificus]